MPIWNKIIFQDRNSPLIEHLLFLHDHCFIIIIVIIIGTSIFLIKCTIDYSTINFNRFFTENQEIEYFWTSIPAFILLFLSIPSIKILYITEEFYSPAITVKITGHQWYWSYEYPEFKNLSFDSYMESSDKIRLLEVSNSLILPINTTIRLLITSRDVIHSWTIPSLGIKVDAVPGRINQLITSINRIGILTGQCREICGANHRFMPIIISGILPSTFINSINS